MAEVVASLAGPEIHQHIVVTGPPNPRADPWVGRNSIYSESKILENSISVDHSPQ